MVSFWQSSLWSDILTQTHQAEVITFSSWNHTIIIERRKIWRNYTGLYILGVDRALITEALVSSLRSEVVQKWDLFLQVEPIDEVEEDRKQKTENRNDYIVNPSLLFILFYFFFGRKAPFRRFIEPVTAILNLEDISEGALLASFAEKGRYNIRLAQKRGVKSRFILSSTEYQVPSTEIGTEASRNSELGAKTYIEAFYDLLDETTRRDGFAHNSLEYYQHFVETLEENNAGWLLVAEKDGILHAAGIFVYQGGNAVYYYGASSSNPAIRRNMATYLLQWEAIREAMRRNCKTYDFLWISEDWSAKLAGVTEFKLRFNPEKVRLPDERVVVYKPFILKLLQVVSKVRKLLL